MTKKQVIIVASAVLVAIVLIGGGLRWHSHEQRRKQSLAKAKQAAQEMSDGSSNLSVNGPASDLGQLGGNQSQSPGSGASSGSTSDIDPSTFTQYDKYKNNADALFGDIQAGNGTALAAGHKAGIYYKAWLTNGAQVDQSPVSSNGQPQPFAFTLGAHQVIPGLEEGVYGMKAGGKRLVIVPPSAGYGSQGQGTVPPNAVLVFEVQLVSVQ